MTSSITLACQAELDLPQGDQAVFYSLPKLERLGFDGVHRLPVSIRIMLESLLRNCDGHRVTEDHLRGLATWKPNAPRTVEVPFVVGRVVLNCAAGIPLLGDLSAMRDAMHSAGLPASRVEPRVPVDMTLDHTLSVDVSGSPLALRENMRLEIERNTERFSFAKWAVQAFNGIRLLPPGYGILHQINLEFFAPGLMLKDGVAYPDTLVGTDSHTCMIAGIGTVGWGVGGIEADAAVLGLPVYLLTPDVVGVHLSGKLRPGVTATDLVLHLTNLLRKEKVVGKFVEFFGEGSAMLTVPDRATLANMAPEYGATIGYFPVDEQTCRYFQQTGRPQRTVDALRAYHMAQGTFGAPREGDIDYSRVLNVNLDDIEPTIAGPKRPQDRIALREISRQLPKILALPPAEGGYGPRPLAGAGIKDGDLVIAAITSCTNTSNPGVMLAAGLLARNAFRRGLSVPSRVKTSLAPGSSVVSEYLEAAGLQSFLDKLGFNVVGYSCTTCVGSSGPLAPAIEEELGQNDIVACAVLSGNRNFEARIHPLVRAAFLASPPLVVAFALAGRMGIDFEREAIGHDGNGKPVMLADIWPTEAELNEAMSLASQPEHYLKAYGRDPDQVNPLWAGVSQASGPLFPWSEASDYIRRPPFLTDPALGVSSLRELHGARALVLLDDSITTDHISPIGNIKPDSPAGVYLQQKGVRVADFNNYGARRMNHEVMVRGAFANIRLRNHMAPGSEGGVTRHQPSGEEMSIFDASIRYAREQVPLLVFAGEEYGTGSARDWAAKGTRLLGVRAVIASSFERIHRSNLVGMGVLPCQLPAGTTWRTLALRGDERFDLLGLHDAIKPRAGVRLRITRPDGSSQEVALVLRLDTEAEVSYAARGGILPYITDQMKAMTPAVDLAEEQS
jgi:aconitate hydratase